MKSFVLPALLMLSACVPVMPADTATRAVISDSTLPPMKTFASARPQSATRSNFDLARDFMDLAFRLESGRNLPVLSRFEGPITVRVIGDPPPSLNPDLSRLLHRLRSEAGIDIRRVNGPANITIQAVPRADIRRALPQAACFVVPNIESIADFRRTRRSPKTDWAQLVERQKLAIFLPNDTSPQETRDCLHEELAQAIGPLNDLYRLPDSVFNDDNVHTVLTGFDMTILRAYYDPRLHSGMTPAQVEQRLPAILSDINPAGAGLASDRTPETPRSWIDAIERALGPGANASARQNAARRALQIAKSSGWTDHRLAFSHYANGRLVQSTQAQVALSHFVAADRIYAQTRGTELHRAYVATQLAAYAVSQGNGPEALRLTTRHLATAERHENAALLSTLLLLRAEALDQNGRTADARAVRLDSLGWARYGFGSDWAVRTKLREIAELSPQGSTGG